MSETKKTIQEQCQEYELKRLVERIDTNVL